MGTALGAVFVTFFVAGFTAVFAAVFTFAAAFRTVLALVIDFLIWLCAAVVFSFGSSSGVQVKIATPSAGSFSVTEYSLS